MKEKLNKKHLFTILVLLAGSILLFTVTFTACSAMLLPYSPNEDTESETIQLPTHLGQEETSSNEESTSDTESSKEESSTPDTEPETTDSESLTTESIEETTEETTEPEPEFSFEFTSNGNGTCSVSGIGNIPDAYITIPVKSPEGDIVTSISEKAFYGNSTIRAVEIPSTIYYIGDMAFSNCSQLVYISVDDASTSFTDLGGILYTADMTRLVSYPSANGASAISIPESVTKIAPMAFYNCAYLKAINYQGSAEQWSKIDIGQMNYGLYSASIICEK